MELLKQRILQDGRSLPGGILKVDSFLNHQLDPNLMYKLAEEFARLFADKKINKIVTIEASGIAPAIMLGYQMQLPVVFIKKKQPKTMDNMLVSEVRSFTKNRVYTVCISNSFLTADDHVLFIDDFLAYGNAAMAPQSRAWDSSLRKVFKAAATSSARQATTCTASPSSTASTIAKSHSDNILIKSI